MKIEMVAAKVREDRYLELQAHDAFHLDRVRRNLHHGVTPSGIDDLPEQAFQIRSFGRRTLRCIVKSGTPIFDRSQNGRRMAGLLQYRFNQVGGGCLSVRARHADQV